ncbi:expressed protein [Chlorella variabilis]|uniref:Expressed protein n=1 Tax=Chlorella variabilis TaxID=554065 RepID=E1ZS84_CHLVA|nr:expressed protein [Chlorella variabilis]EFN51260.1 expressed protein [Chlorella variabilis]|eukprot:XP_005843362.1 expressed protein [Chlorella variabilis]
MTHFVGSEGSTQGPVSVVGDDLPDMGGMEWDDVDAFLDDYLKELGPEAQGQDAFGNFGIDFAPSTAVQPEVLGAWGPSAPTPSALPADSTQQQGATMLTSQLRAQALGSQQGPAAAPQRAASEAVQQPARATRARRAAAAASAGAAAAQATSAGTSRGGSGGSRGGKETKKELDMKKHLALQEKNRRAQRRFRERQKQRVAELEEQVAALQAQLQAAAAGEGGAAAVVAPLPAPAAVRHVASEGDDMMLHDAVPKLEPNASPRAVVGAHLPASDDDPPLAAAFKEALTLTVRQGHPVHLTARQLADMTPAELARHYKAYVNELAGILVESDNPGAAPTQARAEPPGCLAARLAAWPDRVRRLVEEVCLLSTRTAVCNPPGSKHFALTKVDDVSNQPADARVPQIARALDITQQQRRQLSQLRGLLLQKLARVAAERQDINHQLAGAVPGGTGSRHLASRYLVAHDCQRRLRESLREEHALVLDFASTIHKHASGGSGSGATLAGAHGSGGPATSVGMPMAAGGAAGPMFQPAAFGGMQAPPMFGQRGMAGPFGQAAPLLHAPGGGSDAMNNQVGHTGHSGMHLQLLTTGGSGCLAGPPGMSHLSAAGSGRAGFMCELAGSGQAVPISPNMAALSTANDA